MYTVRRTRVYDRPPWRHFSQICLLSLQLLRKSRPNLVPAVHVAYVMAIILSAIVAQ